MDAQKCESKTKLGKCCKKKRLEGSTFCEFHKTQHTKDDDKQVLLYYNEECPVCFSSDGEMHITSCMHRIHLECAEGTKKLECPLCMTIVSNYPKKITDQIKVNAEEYQKKLDREDFESFIAYQNEVNNAPSTTIQVSPSIQMEILSAIHCLKENGIPLAYIPTNIKILVHRDSPPVPQGTLFYAIVGHSIERVTSDIENIYDHVSYDESEDYDESSEENPFSDEIDNVHRTIDIRII